jgi:hypothetical protein
MVRVRAFVSQSVKDLKYSYACEIDMLPVSVFYQISSFSGNLIWAIMPEKPSHIRVQFPTFGSNNMADARTCELGATLVLHNSESRNNVS